MSKQFQITEANFSKFLSDTTKIGTNLRDRFHALLVFGLDWYAGNVAKKDGTARDPGDASRLTEVVKAAADLKVAGHTKMQTWVEQHSSLHWRKNHKGTEGFGVRKNEEPGVVTMPKDDTDRFWTAANKAREAKPLDVLARINALIDAVMDGVISPASDDDKITLAGFDMTEIRAAAQALVDTMDTARRMAEKVDKEDAAKIARDNAIEDRCNNHIARIESGQITMLDIPDEEMDEYTQSQKDSIFAAARRRIRADQIERLAEQADAAQAARESAPTVKRTRKPRVNHVGKLSQAAAATDPTASPSKKLNDATSVEVTRH